MNWARSEYGAEQVEEAVDVEVVERGLDLVEDVERARLGQEHGEQEGQRGHRLLAAGEQREPLHRLAGRGDLDLDPEQVLLAASSSSASGSSASGELDRRRRLPGDCAAEHAAPGRRARRPGAAGRGRRGTAARPAPRSSRAAASKVCSNVSRICRSVSVISFSSSRSAVSRSVRWRSSSSTCATASAYSSWASGLTGPSCSRRRASRSSRSASASRSSAASASVGGGSASSSSRAASSRSSCSASAAWSRARWSAHLERGQGLVLGVQPRVQRRLLLGAGAQLGGDVLARLAVGGQRRLEHGPLLARSPPPPPRSPSPRLPTAGCELLVALRSPPRRRSIWSARWAARARSARASVPALGGELGRELRAAGSAPGPSSGAARRRSIRAAIRRSSSAASSRSRTAARCAAIAASRSASRRGGSGAPHASSAPRAPVRPERRARSRRSAPRAGCARPAPAPRPTAGAWRSSRAEPDHTRPSRVTAIAGECSAATASIESTTQASRRSTPRQRDRRAGPRTWLGQPLGRRGPAAGCRRSGASCAGAEQTSARPPSAPARSSNPAAVWRSVDQRRPEPAVERRRDGELVPGVDVELRRPATWHPAGPRAWLRRNWLTAASSPPTRAALPPGRLDGALGLADAPGERLRRPAPPASRALAGLLRRRRRARRRARPGRRAGARARPAGGASSASRSRSSASSSDSAPRSVRRRLDLARQRRACLAASSSALARALQPDFDRRCRRPDRLGAVADPLGRGLGGEAAARELLALRAAGGQRLLGRLAAPADRLELALELLALEPRRGRLRLGGRQLERAQAGVVAGQLPAGLERSGVSRAWSSAASAWRLSGRSRERASRSTSSARSRLSWVRSSLSCARRRRLRCLPSPAASSISSRGRAAWR